MRSVLRRTAVCRAHARCRGGARAAAATVTAEAGCVLAGNVWSLARAGRRAAMTESVRASSAVAGRARTATEQTATRARQTACVPRKSAFWGPAASSGSGRRVRCVASAIQTCATREDASRAVTTARFAGRAASARVATATSGSASSPWTTCGHALPGRSARAATAARGCAPLLQPTARRVRQTARASHPTGASGLRAARTGSGASAPPTATVATACAISGSAQTLVPTARRAPTRRSASRRTAAGGSVRRPRRTGPCALRAAPARRPTDASWARAGRATSAGCAPPTRTARRASATLASAPAACPMGRRARLETCVRAARAAGRCALRRRQRAPRASTAAPARPEAATGATSATDKSDEAGHRIEKARSGMSAQRVCARAMGLCWVAPPPAVCSVLCRCGVQ
mmetsp:Transcript_29112/g.59141  ORF Transcript_29112/g.59141 Transcript_29112/m.59141 type:complete len:403 (+) Transcript_29112:360-1568(+)